MKPSSILLAVLISAYATSPALADRIEATGKLTYLRVHEPKTGYGPDSDKLDGEVVIQLNTESGKAFGFKLREDSGRPAHQGMLDLLRDAFNYNWTVGIEYDIAAGKKNGTIMRVWLTK